ncbi:MAG: DUF423 domain-containing protein [Betaproteobacteria bacterium]|nr:DUF423 domain-containing protein [Betaproteobacteria bacterium]
MAVEPQTGRLSAGRAQLLAIAFALVSGMSAVIASALASHALGHYSPTAQASWDVAARMHLAHSLLMLLMSLCWAQHAYRLLGVSCLLLGLGVILFSVNIYARVLFGDSFVSRLTALGGLCLMAGWLVPLPILSDLWRRHGTGALRS